MSPGDTQSCAGDASRAGLKKQLAAAKAVAVREQRKREQAEREQARRTQAEAVARAKADVEQAEQHSAEEVQFVKTAVVVLCGGNIGAAKFAAIVGEHIFEPL